jgi:hypothetical protein
MYNRQVILTGHKDPASNLWTLNIPKGNEQQKWTSTIPKTKFELQPNVAARIIKNGKVQLQNVRALAHVVIPTWST